MLRFLLAVAMCLGLSAPALATHQRPNIVVVMLDDARAGVLQHMPLTRAALGGSAVTFNNMFVEVALCGPSRASFFTGRYAHNHGVETCEMQPNGGWQAFRKSEPETLAVWLSRAGYRTDLVGKYMNNYETLADGWVPPGWSTWNAWASGNQRKGFGYGLVEGGRIVWHGTAQADFATDVLAQRGVEFMRASANAGRPFFLYFAPSSGHEPWAYPQRHAGLFAGATWPGPYEADISDKPAFYRDGAVSLNSNDIYRRYRRSIVSADEAVDRIWDTVRDLGKAANTWVFVMSDNGSHFGEHRLPAGKRTLYDVDVRVPLMIRGPGLEPRTESHMVTMADLPATILAITGAEGEPMDGKSLKPMLDGEQVGPWRTSLPLAHYANPDGTPWPNARGVRTERYTWVEHATGDRELYDNLTDPRQFDNLAGTDPLLEVTLSGLSRALASCVEDGCP